MPIHRVGSTGDSALPHEGGQPAGQHAAEKGRGGSAADSADLSELAALLEQIDELLREEPERFGRLMASVADRLEGQRVGASADVAEAIARLAEEFRRAGAERSLGPISPPASPSHPPAHPGVQSYAAQRAPAGGLVARLPGVDLAQILREALRDLGP